MQKGKMSSAPFPIKCMHWIWTVIMFIIAEYRLKYMEELSLFGWKHRRSSSMSSLRRRVTLSWFAKTNHSSWGRTERLADGTALPRHEVHRSPLRFEEAGTGRTDQAGENGLGRSVMCGELSGSPFFSFFGVIPRVCETAENGWLCSRFFSIRKQRRRW